MNKFHINNKEYQIEEFSSNTLEINSVPKPYNVYFNSSPQDALLCYDEGDIFLVDKNVNRLYYSGELFSQHKERTFLIEATEENKSIDTVLQFTRFLLDSGFTKKSKVIVIGGGITQDIAAFSAAVYKRGINWVYFPTTLLSMCDSCIGGKTGINFENIKNQLALFSSPTAIYMAPKFLSTLDDEEIRSGLGECIKLFKMAGNKSLEVYKECVSKGSLVDGMETTLIQEALQIKKAVIEDDEFETGNRTALNYGHTIGHALEVVSGYKIPHGKSVAIGCVIEDRICQNDKEEDISSLVHELIKSPVDLAIDYDKVFTMVTKDRKVLGDKIKIATSPKPGEISFLVTDLDDNFRQRMELYLREFFV